MANALAEVQETYLSLDKNYSLLLAACQTEAQREQLEAQYAQAQDAYEKCLGQMLDADTAEIADLTARLKVVNAQIAGALSVMGDMSKVLNVITQALTIGEELIAAAGL